MGCALWQRDSFLFVSWFVNAFITTFSQKHKNSVTPGKYCANHQHEELFFPHETPSSLLPQQTLNLSSRSPPWRRLRWPHTPFPLHTSLTCTLPLAPKPLVSHIVAQCRGPQTFQTVPERLEKIVTLVSHYGFSFNWCSLGTGMLKNSPGWSEYEAKFGKQARGLREFTCTFRASLTPLPSPAGLGPLLNSPKPNALIANCDDSENTGQILWVW